MAFPGTAKAEACVLPGSSSDDRTLCDCPVLAQRSQKAQFTTGRPKEPLSTGVETRQEHSSKLSREDRIAKANLNRLLNLGSARLIIVDLIHPHQSALSVIRPIHRPPNLSVASDMPNPGV